MGKRCECAAILEAARSNPYLRLVAPGARWLWLMLVDTMLRAAEPGVFMVGSAVGSVGDMSMMFSIEKVDAEKSVESLEKVGLLARRADGAVVLGAEAPRPVVRGNGGRAPVLGRPRKGEGKEDYARRQRELRLLGAVEGGVGKSLESRLESPSRAGAEAALLEEKEDKQAGGESPVPEDWQRIGDRAMDAAGLDGVRWPGNYGFVRAWLAEGIGEATIIEAIERVMARPNAPKVGGLKYFNEIVRSAAKAARPADGGRQCPRWRVAFERWVDGGQVGPRPEFEAYWREFGERAA